MKGEKIVIAGGGSGGHTSAAIGIIDTMLEAGFDIRQFLWIGSASGVERSVAGRAGIDYRVISVGKLRRYWSVENFIDLGRIAKGLAASVSILRTLSPTIVIGTGGFVSVPVLAAARLLRYPVIVHEQTVIPGLANRLAARFADKVLVSYQESGRYFRNVDIEVVGNPLRSELRGGLRSRSEAKERLDLDQSLPLLYVTGGAHGANALNQVVAESLERLLPAWQIIHQCGSGTMDCSLSQLIHRADALPPDLARGYRPTAYVGQEIADVLAAADLVLTRSGAAIVNEIVRLGLASILVPYPQSAGGEQLRLAQILSGHNAAILIEEGGLSSDMLVTSLLSLDEQRRDRLRQNALALAPSDVEKRLITAITDTMTSGYQRSSVLS